MTAETPAQREAHAAARADAIRGQADPTKAWLADIEATTRSIAAEYGLSPDASVYGEHCVNCEERWCLPAHKATCPHMPICEDCWPNGCDVCEQGVEAGIRRREEATARIVSAALELRTQADDLSETDLGQLNWTVQNDLRRHVGLAIEALRRVHDTLNVRGESQ